MTGRTGTKKTGKTAARSIPIPEITPDETINVVLETLKNDKQVIVFVNAKKSAESLAEKIALAIKKHQFTIPPASTSISHALLHALDTPTKQCRRLATSVESGAAFHHSGLTSKQRDIIEEEFRKRNIKVIVGTTTLAAGVDLPAYRVIIRDVKRFTNWGMQYIPVLEYEQQSGRAGRPSFDTHGEAIVIADSASQKTELIERYIRGVPEEIISKLAAEPIMRTYILSLIASGFVTTTYELESFFEKTFYAHEYGDMQKLRLIIRKMLEQLETWEFITCEGLSPDSSVAHTDFVSALTYAFGHDGSREKRVQATLIGKRVSELYLDPYTAREIIVQLRAAYMIHTHPSPDRAVTELSYLTLFCTCLELRPVLRVKVAEIPRMQEFLAVHLNEFLAAAPEPFLDEYEEFLGSLKTVQFFIEWLSEKDEEYLLETFNVTPGELNAKRDLIDWLLYSSEELAKLLKMHLLVKDLAKLRFRMKYGVREELIPLLQLKGIGRMRARKLFNNKIRDIADVKKVDITTLSELVGRAVALDIKKQVGQDLSAEHIEVKEHKRKGQISLNDWG